MLGHAAAEVAEAPKDLHVPTPGRLPNPAPHDSPPPRNEPPRSGQPQPAPQPDAAPKPKGALPPYGLTESKAPAGQKPPVAAPKPAVVEATNTAVHADTSAPKAVSHELASAPPTALLGAQPHGGAPSAYQPQSLAHDHHGPVAHAVEPLTTEHLSALNNYTGLGHEDLNDMLRTGTLDASQQARVDALNRALEKMPPHSGLVYRGTDLPPEVLAQYQPGAVVTEDAFVSTSVDPAVARSPAFAGNVEFRIVSRDRAGHFLALLDFPRARSALPIRHAVLRDNSNDRSPDGHDDHRNGRAVGGIERWPRKSRGKHSPHQKKQELPRQPKRNWRTTANFSTRVRSG